ncbi:NAD-dependent protein deacetylase hst4 [Zalerion maritima]|uniref:NAD-dependent protein deacetylase hst4 n=1 Tax=Zalerion maritima TaxID=339359 RepID=A0AAD5RJ62_9PEZI|nr:NAD-dependent protein deacetylase hst4 [Zalerion maritima]
MESAQQKPPPPLPPPSSSNEPTSSPVVELSESPSPPAAAKFPTVRYPTPQSSLESGNSSPMSKRTYSSDDSSKHRGPGRLPPAKRRKGPRGTPIPRAPKQPKERVTQHLSLAKASTGNNEEQDQMLDRLIHALRYKKKIVIVAGAGISVSAGIPDFRSKKGLFASQGKHLFDSSVYKHDKLTSDFHDMIRSLFELSKDAVPTRFHHLVASLANEGRLQRLYTQNVDGLETSMPPLATTIPLAPRKPKDTKDPWPKTVQLHGTLGVMHCTKCEYSAELDPSIFTGTQTPDCPSCTETDHVRTGIAGKRSHGIGRLRPRMLLYNESGPDDSAIGAVSTADIRSRPDAILVVGTSLKVPGVRRIVREMCHTVRSRRTGIAAWINFDSQGPHGVDLKGCFDLVVEGKSDDVASLVNLPRWDDSGAAIDEAAFSDEFVKLEERKLRFDRVEVRLPIQQVERHGQAATRVKKEEGTVTPRDSPQPPAFCKKKGAQTKQATLAFHGKKTATDSQPAAKPTKSKAKRRHRKPKEAKPAKVNLTQTFRATKTMAPATVKPTKDVAPTKDTANLDSSSLPPLRPSRPNPAPSTPERRWKSTPDGTQANTSFRGAGLSPDNIPAPNSHRRTSSTETISPTAVPRGMEGLLD